MELPKTRDTCAFARPATTSAIGASLSDLSQEIKPPDIRTNDYPNRRDYTLAPQSRDDGIYHMDIPLKCMDHDQ